MLGANGQLRVVALANVLPYRGTSAAPVRVWDVPAELGDTSSELSGGWTEQLDDLANVRPPAGGSWASDDLPTERMSVGDLGSTAG